MSEGVEEPGVAFEQEPQALENARDPEADWTPEAVAAVERAVAELATGGGVPHSEVLRRTRELLGR